MLSVWTVFIYAGIAVYTIVAGLIIWSAIAYRRRDPNVRQAAGFHDNPKLEITWTVIPVLIVIGLFVKTYAVEKKVEAVAATPGQVVDVVAYRWSWRFSYPDHHVVVDGSLQSPPTLVLPLGETSEIRLTSSDIVHSFWIPAFIFKRDANPGMTNVFDLKPTRLGTFPARCAEYCGTYHALMAFTVRVVTPTDFERWLKQKGGMI